MIGWISTCYRRLVGEGRREGEGAELKNASCDYWVD